MKWSRILEIFNVLVICYGIYWGATYMQHFIKDRINAKIEETAKPVQEIQTEQRSLSSTVESLTEKIYELENKLSDIE